MSDLQYTPMPRHTKIEGYFRMLNDFGTDWYLTFDKVSTFGLDAGGRFWVRCDGVEYGTHNGSYTQFNDFVDQFREFRTPSQNNRLGVKP